MKLSTIIAAIEPMLLNGTMGDIMSRVGETQIGSIHYRSHEVKPGGLFVALKGRHADGHDFINDAILRGAVAVVAQGPGEVGNDAVMIRVENTRKALAGIAACFYGNPSDKLFLIGVTGTNGKTTTAFLLEHILSGCGIAAGVIGTIHYRYGGGSFQNPLTTPESADLQRILSKMAHAGVTHVIMEVSSHGVALDRISCCRFDMGVFTNLSQDHLDFHGSMEDYWSCKKRFFIDYLSTGPKQGRAVAVLNHDDEKGRELAGLLEHIDLVTVGGDASAMVYPVHVRLDPSGIKAEIKTPKGVCAFKSGLIGRHNLENLLCAAGAGVAMQIPLSDISAGIESFSHVPGRLEPVPNGLKRHVYVDYAHTPDALAKVLAALKRIATGRLICVFGCGGDRDKSKRPQMGEIAGRLCDLVVITSDNPRSESPEAIIEDIVEGVASVMEHRYLPKDLDSGIDRKGFVVEPDREKAIFLSIRSSGEGDTILVAGKGHETYQLIGGKTIPFDDREIAAKAVSAN